VLPRSQPSGDELAGRVVIVGRPEAERNELHALREYALVADGERGALVGPRGDVVWMCFPHWHSDAAFSTLVGGGGVYEVAPVERFVWGGYYEERSLIWRSRWTTDRGARIECREALALPSSRSRAVMLRRVIALEGRARVRVALDVRLGFGAHAIRDLTRTDGGEWRGSAGGVSLCWSGGADARAADADGGGARLELLLELDEGDQHDLVLVLAVSETQAEAPPADTAWSGTEAAWRERVPGLERMMGRRDAWHAHAVLSGLTSSGGGMVAAATTSLPERAREGRNYDYRYVWVRDQAFAGQAAAKAADYPLLDHAVRFVRARLLDDGAQLQPAYTIDGGRVPDQRRLDLPGYPGADVIVGNHVNAQFQLDVFGESLLLFSAAGAHDRLDAEVWQAAEVAAGAIEQRWHEADAGIWETRNAQWTHSRLICAAGLRAISAHGPGGEQAARWLALADAITAEASANALHPTGRWQRAADDPRVDAALLLIALRGAIPPDDPRTIATLDAYVRELTQDGYAYRYRLDERPLGEAEGAFLLCGFILALAYAQQGHAVASARSFERTRAASGPPALLSEEFDVTQRQLRGNLPQAFVHALLLECAVEQYDMAPD
jgi:hypothetical protein